VPFDGRVSRYDHVMVLDVDVLVSAVAPPFHTLGLGGTIGIVDDWCQPSVAELERGQAENGLVSSARAYHALAGFEIDTPSVLNSGMFIVSPSLHNAFFRGLVDDHAELHARHPIGPHFEQAALSFELQRRELAAILPA